MTNPPPADQTYFGHLVLEFEICLGFGPWSLGFPYAITPLLQHTTTLEKAHWNPLRGRLSPAGLYSPL